MKDIDKRHEATSETAPHIQDLPINDYAVEFPIDLNLDSMIPIILPEMKWENFNCTPSTMKLSNQGKSVILTTHWGKKKRPYINGGPLLGNYIFSRLHFLWGKNNFKGGKHTFNRKTFPLETHALFYKSEYGNFTEALQHRDGAIVLVFASKIEKSSDPAIGMVCENLSALSKTGSSVQVNPFKISDFFHTFSKDYFLYWGSINTLSCNHLLLWLVCRRPFHITKTQVHSFRKLMTTKQNHIINNSHSTSRIHPSFKRVFHINPSKYINDVLYDEELTEIEKNRSKVIDKKSVGRPSTVSVPNDRNVSLSSLYRPHSSVGGDIHRRDIRSRRLGLRNNNLKNSKRNSKNEQEKFEKRKSTGNTKYSRTRNPELDSRDTRCKSKDASDKNCTQNKSIIPDLFDDSLKKDENKLGEDGIEGSWPCENKTKRGFSNEIAEHLIYRKGNGDESCVTVLQSSGIRRDRSHSPIEDSKHGGHPSISEPIMEVDVDSELLSINKMNNLPGGEGELRTIYSEGSIDSVSNKSNRDNALIGNFSSGVPGEVSFHKSMSSMSSDILVETSERIQKPRYIFTKTSSSCDNKLSIKDSLEIIRQYFPSSASRIDASEEERILSESRNIESPRPYSRSERVNSEDDTIVKPETSKLRNESVSVKPAKCSSKSQVRSRAKSVKVRFNQSLETENIKSNAPPRWRY